MGFVEIVSLLILLLVGVAGLLQGGLTLAGRDNAPTSGFYASRWPRAAAYLLGGLAALIVAVLWLVS